MIALDANDIVMTFGENASGGLGNGTFTNHQLLTLVMVSAGLSPRLH